MQERGKRLRAWIVASGVAGGATLGGMGVASAQTSGTTTALAAGTAMTNRGPGPGGPHGPGRGFGGGGIHGEFVTAKDGGGYQTMATQRGEVTAVSASSITVKSEDGYTKTYVIDANTKVHSTNNAIGDVKTGDKVGIRAVVDGSTYRALDMGDETHPGARPAPPAAPAAPAA